ncbi:hypothetical protein [Thermoclostridium caenicola]|nr:hypothetical protein [Thermoclostridium caenicola]
MVAQTIPDMTVIVRPGKAWINGYILINDDDYILQLDPADGVLHRIDRVVVRYDTIDREIRLEIKKGQFGSQPVAPALQRDADAYELALADIYVAAGAVSITQANITDLRLNTELCGIVHGTVEQVDTTTLFNQYLAWLQEKKSQYEQYFYAWFEHLQDILDENVAGNLLNLIESHKTDRNNPHGVTAEQIGAETPAGAQSKVDTHAAQAASISALGHVYHAILTVTLDTNWSGSSAPFSKTVTVNGIQASDTPIIDVVMSGTYATDTSRLEAWSKIYRAVTEANKITFYATDKPTVSIPVQVKVVR